MLTNEKSKNETKKILSSGCPLEFSWFGEQDQGSMTSNLFKLTVLSIRNILKFLFSLLIPDRTV